jgi:hypothetical protein
VNVTSLPAQVVTFDLASGAVMVLEVTSNPFSVGNVIQVRSFLAILEFPSTDGLPISELQAEAIPASLCSAAADTAAV